MPEYGFYLTDAGEQLVHAAIIAKTKIDLAYFACGDGIWAADEERQSLKHEVIELPVSAVNDASNPLMPMLELVIPPTVGGFRLSEIVLRALLADGSKVDFAISKYAGTYLPDPSTNPWTVDQQIYVDVNIGTAGVIQVRYNPIVCATREYVDAQMQLLGQAIQAAVTGAVSDLTEQINTDQNRQDQALADHSHRFDQITGDPTNAQINYILNQVAEVDGGEI